jgi:hypothetical protein
MNIESDIEGQESSDSETSRASTARENVLIEWEEQFSRQTPTMQQAWNESHRNPEYENDFRGDRWECIEASLVPLDGVDLVHRSTAFLKLLEYAEGVRVKLKAIDRLERRGTGYHIGSTLNQIEDVEARDVLPGVIPAGEITVGYGSPKAGKSAFAHKLAICVASDDTEFDGEPIMHGRVLFVTLDPGARKAQVKRRMMQIYERLGIDRRDDTLILVDDVMFLDDPLSVDSLLRKNPGKYVLVVIDPLYKALSNGDPSVASSMTKATEGMKTIAETTGAAVLILHHATKASDEMFGSVFLKAALDSQLFVERTKDTVRVAVEVVKNGAPRETPFTYRLDGAYLESLDKPKIKNVEVEPLALRPDMIAMVPITGKPVKASAARKLIAKMLKGKTPSAREKEWERIRQSWADAGWIIQNSKARSIRRVVEVAPDGTIRRIVGEGVK